MKNITFLILFIYLTNCYSQNDEIKLQVSINETDMKEQSKFEVPKDAFKLNIGFNDNPQWIWAKYDHLLSDEDFIYKYIYGIKFWNEEGPIDTLYYEADRALKNSLEIDFKNYIINLYPGDKTIQLIGKENDTLYLFNVLENKEFRRNFKGKPFQRIPTVKLNDLQQKVSDFDIEINIEATENSNIYLVTTIDEQGVKNRRYKSNCNKKDEAFVLSYFDTTNNRIYLLEKDCFLEEIID